MPCQSPYPTPGLCCLPSQTRCVSHPVRLRQTKHGQCGLGEGRPMHRKSPYPTPGSSCLPSQNTMRFPSGEIVTDRTCPCALEGDASCLARKTRRSGCGIWRLAMHWAPLSKATLAVFGLSQSHRMGDASCLARRQHNPGVGYGDWQGIWCSSPRSHWRCSVCHNLIGWKPHRVRFIRPDDPSVGCEDWRSVRIPLQGHTDWVWSVAISSDGSRIVLWFRRQDNSGVGCRHHDRQGIGLPPSKATLPPLTLLQSHRMDVTSCPVQMTRPFGYGIWRLGRHCVPLSKGTLAPFGRRNLAGREGHHVWFRRHNNSDVGHGDW